MIYNTENKKSFKQSENNGKENFEYLYGDMFVMTSKIFVHIPRIY